MKLSLNRILLPTDFSPASVQARNYACSIAGPLDAELHVLHVLSYPHLPSGPTDSWFVPEEQRVPVVVHDAELQLEAEMADSLIKGSRIVKAIRYGEPSHEILAYAKEHEIELIVQGTHGRTGLSHVLIGSVAEKIVQRAECPVLTVHAEGLQETADQDCRSNTKCLA